MFKVFLISVFSLFVISCAVRPVNIEMTPSQRENLNVIKIYNLVVQDEVRFLLSLSPDATGVRIVGQDMGDSFNYWASQSEKKLMDKFYEVTEKIDVRKILGNGIYIESTGHYSIIGKQESAQTIKLSSKKLEDKIDALVEGEALLYIENQYYFVNDAKTLQTTTSAKLYFGGVPKKSVEKKPFDMDETEDNVIQKRKPGYYNTFVYQSDQVGPGKGDSLSLWGRHDGALFVSTLEESASLVSLMLNYDLNPKLNKNCLESAKAYHFGPYDKSIVKGEIVLNDTDWVALRGSKDGAIYLFPTTALLSAGLDGKSVSHCNSSKGGQ
ncbi:MAG: hypothetical protein COC04_04530 [Gammaproteobacteria bacterium]|nr:MAG: hypothetical protein COC04_04530 [Gammaproteobacteria bacterium]